MTKREIDAWLRLVAERAAELRSTGVRKLELPGVLCLELDEYVPAPQAQPAEQGTSVRTIDISGDADLADPLNDPATYPGGKVPGFERPRRREVD
jgi:hypothetical protein